MGDRFWPARRWLADRLIGDHAYSRNVATWPDEFIMRNDLTGETYHASSSASWPAPLVFQKMYRNPGETA